MSERGVGDDAEDLVGGDPGRAGDSSDSSGALDPEPLGALSLKPEPLGALSGDPLLVARDESLALVLGEPLSDVGPRGEHEDLGDIDRGDSVEVGLDSGGGGGSAGSECRGDDDQRNDETEGGSRRHSVTVRQRVRYGRALREGPLDLSTRAG